MDSILIHTCKERLWFVDEYLKPKIKSLYSSVRTGTPVVSTFVDIESIGNQKAFIKSIEESDIVYNLNSNTWHLQDDVWPSKKFSKVISSYEQVPGIICGFGTRPSCRGKVPGWTTVYGMYRSFQCIRIPNRILWEFYDYLKAKENKGGLLDKWEDHHFDDFLKREYPFYPVLNLSPSIVEHVDYLIGGSIVNKDRSYIPTAIEFDDEKSLSELEKLLSKRKEN